MSDKLKNKEIRVLLIEDDEEDFILTQDVLSRINGRKYKLDWVSTYELGLHELREGKYDAYLIDNRLGAESGLDLISTAVSEGCLAPMILLTGLGNAEIDEKAMTAGAADYLIKDSIDPETLDRSIRYSIRQFQLLAEVKELHEESEQKVIERTWELAEAIKQLEKTNSELIDEIGSRKKAEKEKEINRRLYVTIGENYPNGFIAVLNKNLEYVFVAGQLLKDLKLNRNELLDKSFKDHFSADYVKYLDQNFSKAFNGEKSVFEMHFIGRELQAYALPLLEPDGQSKHIMLVAQDITQRKKAIEDVNKALEKERQLNELKSGFVSMASHEFRTPLGTILSSASLIGKYNSTGDEEKRSKHINRIKASVVNLTSILNDFLSLSKLEEGKVSFMPIPIDIRELLDEIKEEMQVTTKDGQEIIIEHSVSICTIETDKQILKNVLINLTSNAIKYSPENKIILIRTETNDSNVTIDIIDHGIGIPFEDQKHLFETFFRAGNVANIQGTGLGLNIVKKYLDILNGHITFESEPGKGTRFTVKIDKFEPQIPISN